MRRLRCWMPMRLARGGRWALLAVLLVFAPACGGGESGYRAKGAYVFLYPSLTLSPTSSNFPAGCGPAVGSDVTVTVTFADLGQTMIFDEGTADEIAWTLNPGTGSGSGDPELGEWICPAEDLTLSLEVGGTWHLRAGSGFSCTSL